MNKFKKFFNNFYFLSNKFAYLWTKSNRGYSPFNNN